MGKMRVPGRRARVGVTEQRADERQARAAAHQLRGVRVPQVMDAQPADLCGLNELPPILLQFDAMTGAADTGEDKGRQHLPLASLLLAYLAQQLPRRSAQRHLMVLFLL